MHSFITLIAVFAFLRGILSVSNSTTSNSESELIFAHVIFRHGDRTIISSYPTDPYKSRSYWPEGFGQLTNLGKEEHFELGKFLRRRYKSLLGSQKYASDLVNVQSTDVDRTLMSAEANMAGLFAPTDGQIWNPNLLWQPVPIHTTPEALDYVLAGKKHCPRLDYAMKKYLASDEYRNIIKKYKVLIDYLEKNTGREFKSLMDIEYLYDTLFIENLRNLTLPKWTETIFPHGDLEWISHRQFQVFTNTPTLARLQIGFLLKEIFDRSQAKAENNITQNLWIYSAHDNTIANVLNALGMFWLHSPPYCATLMIELHKINNEYSLQLLYKNSTNENLQPLNIPQCGTSCPLNRLFELYKDILPDKDFETECKISVLTMTYEEADLNDFKIATTALAFVVVALILLLLYTWRTYRQRYTTRIYSRI